MTWPAKYIYVAAIEGLDTLLTNGDTTAVKTAWSGTDWTSVTGGLFVDLQQEQSADPWEPFQGGGTLTLTIQDDDIGIIMNRTAGGAESELTTGVDRNDTSIVVQDTTAFPSSGTIHCGTEAMTYSSKTSTTFTVTRGKWHPFGCDSSGTGGTHYGQNHRVGFMPYGPALAPKVTQYPREWIGRWVGLWVHGYDSDGTLQTKDNATLVFAGRIAEVRDDPDVLGTIIEIDHVLTDLKEATVGRDMLDGEVADGIYIPASGTTGAVKFYWQDESAGIWKTANALEVVSSGASGANQMNEGFYTHDELFAKMNEWLASELSNGRLWGTYSLGIATTQGTPESLRTKVYWRIQGTANTTVQWRGSMHKAIAIFLGFDGSDTSDPIGTITIHDSDKAATLHHFYRDWIPLRSWVTNGLSTAFLRIVNASGAFQDQLSTLPESADVPANATGSWGIFLFNDQVLIRAKVTDNQDGTLDLASVITILAEQTGPFSSPPLATYAKRLDDPTPTKIRQVFIFEMPRGDMINRLVYSGGTEDYNHDTHDAMPLGCGIGYPGGLLGDSWETSVANMPGSDKSIAVMIDKPTKLSKVIGSDLVLCHAFPVWKSGGLRMATWQSPIANRAIATLDEDNKAEPSGRSVNHRSPVLVSTRWSKPLVKIEYNRDPASGEYRGTINIEDRTAIDSMGDRAEPFTIEARNSYTYASDTGEGIESLMQTVFIPVMHMFSKETHTMRRSISRDQFEGLAPGDIVKVTDKFARDPTTGIRHVTARPAIVIHHEYSPGGPVPNSNQIEPMTGMVELMFVATNRMYAYSPSALVSSYTSGTKALTLAEHEYSESSEDADVEHFEAGDLIRVIEIDPDDPTSPLSWTDTIDSISGNVLTLTTGLSSEYDATKTYRVIPDTYSSVQDSQQDKAFQADETDGLVEDDAQAYQFGLATSDVTATASSHTDLPERHAELTYGDGKPYDVGSVVGVAKMINNLIDHKTACSTPELGAVMSNTTYSSGSGWRLVQMRPVFLTDATLSNSVVRYLSVAPFFRSSDGTATSVRITLMPFAYKGDTLNDISRGSVRSDASWSTSSTTWSTGTAALLTMNVNSLGGLAWLIVEANYKCETRGIAKAVEQERQVF